VDWAGLPEELASGGDKARAPGAARKVRLRPCARRRTATCKVSAEVFSADLATSAPEKICLLTMKQASPKIDLLDTNGPSFGNRAKVNLG